MDVAASRPRTVGALGALVATLVLGCTAHEPARPGPAVPLENTTWKLVKLGTAPVEAPAGQREPHLRLDPKEHRVTGSGGCNSMGGTYTVEGETIRFSQMISTKMACREGMQQEHTFHEALSRAARWRIEGKTLTLFDPSGTVVATFEAGAPPER